MQACFCLHKRFLIRFGIGRTPEALGKVINMLKILYEDEQILVVWKPAGTESQESRGFGRDMVSEIRKHIHSQFPEKGIPYVGVIHRLDKPVSGLLVYAKTQKAKHQCAQRQHGADVYVESLWIMWITLWIIC